MAIWDELSCSLTLRVFIAIRSAIPNLALTALMMPAARSSTASEAIGTMFCGRINAFGSASLTRLLSWMAGLAV